MFISKKRWREMEHRVSALEKQSKAERSPLPRIKEALISAFDNAVYRFEYELTNYPEPNSVRQFSTAPKRDHQPDK